jgi:IS4 transposase
MYEGRTVFSQLLDHLPRHTFRRVVKRYRGDHRVRSFTCWDQFLAMVFAQFTYRESLRDIEACLGAIPERLYHLGFRSPVVARATLADANEKRDWRIYADFAQVLIHEARRLYTGESLGLDLDQTVYALDATTIDLCLALFPWAHFRRRKGAIKLHTLLDLQGNIPTFIRITPGTVNELNILDELIPEPGSVYVMDRGYTDFRRLYRWHQAQAFFVIRGKKGLDFRRRYSHPVDKATGLLCDQTIVLQGPKTSTLFPEPLRRIGVRDLETGKRITLLTNHFHLSAGTVAELYRCRWQVELFFKWIKQHLRIKAFYGTSENAVKTQIWIAITVYVLVAIVRKRLGIERDLYTLLQILSVTLLEKTELLQALSIRDRTGDEDPFPNQLQLFNF